MTSATATVQIQCSRCGGSGIYTRFHGTCYGCGGAGTVTVTARALKAQQTRNRNAARAAADRRKANLAWARGMTVDEIVADQIRKIQAGETGYAAHMATRPDVLAEVQAWAEGRAAEVAALFGK
jgi:hypothetical protein